MPKTSTVLSDTNEDPGFSLKFILSKLKRKKIIIFGADSQGEALQKDLAFHNLNIGYYVDFCPDRWNKDLAGINIYHPSEIITEHKKNIVVLIAGSYDMEISKFLQEVGLYEGISYFWYEKLKKYGYNYIKFKSLNKKIIILGGYGSFNTGDEAQLGANLQMLQARFPDYILTVLSPNQYYTHFTHERCLVADAPRTAFYNRGGKISPYNLVQKRDPRGWISRTFLIGISFWMMINAYLARFRLPLLLVSSRQAALINELKTSSLVFYSGGGYLTGKTMSRLWDGIFFMRIAQILKVPVVLSGQTIGVWNGLLNRLLARWGFAKVKMIAVRDPLDSIKALQDIGIVGEKVLITCDDALFCDKITNKEQLMALFRQNGLSEEDLQKGYFAMHIHYWGLRGRQKQDLLAKLQQILQIMNQNTDCRIILIPMVPSDKQAMRDLLKSFPGSNCRILEYDYRYQVIRAVIANAKMCIAMKHHPIIFALGEQVPVISLTLKDYYRHKNIGALTLFDMQEYSVDLEADDFAKAFEKVYHKALNDDIYGLAYQNKCREIESKKAIFIDRIKKLLSGIEERK